MTISLLQEEEVICSLSLCRKREFVFNLVRPIRTNNNKDQATKWNSLAKNNLVADCRCCRGRFRLWQADWERRERAEASCLQQMPLMREKEREKDRRPIGFDTLGEEAVCCGGCESTWQTDRRLCSHAPQRSISMLTTKTSTNGTSLAWQNTNKHTMLNWHWNVSRPEVDYGVAE